MINASVATALIPVLLFALTSCAERRQCAESGVSVSIGLIEKPFPYNDLVPQPSALQISKLPPLPSPADAIVRREHAYISTALAAELGIAPHDNQGNLEVNPDWQGPNPQIRVRLTNPPTISNWESDANYRDRASNAVFTVVGVIDDDSRPILWVYKGLNGADVETDSGQYKLFAEDTVDLAGRVRRIKTFKEDGEGLLDTVTASVFCVPVSRASVSSKIGATGFDYYAENDPSGSYRETAASKDDNRFVLLVPHGGGIETGTSEQIELFGKAFGNGGNTPLNWWSLEGQWGDGQTFKRWHITTTNLSEKSFPALQFMLSQTSWFDGTHPFSRALALHGFSGNAADIIIGGGAKLNAKCHVAKTIKAQPHMGLVAVRIYDNKQIIDVSGNDNHTVCRKGLDGDSSYNIVNRLAAEGGIQIEQSGTIRDQRDHPEYLEGVAKGAATAILDLLAGAEPIDACSGYAAPADESSIPNCP